MVFGSILLGVLTVLMDIRAKHHSSRRPVAQVGEFEHKVVETVNKLYGTADWPTLLSRLGESPRATSLLHRSIHDARPEFRQASAYFVRAMGHAIWWDPACELVSVHCNLCGRDMALALLRRWGLQIVRCRKCGLVYVNPRPVSENAGNRYTEAYFKAEYLPSIPIGPNGEGSFEYYRERLIRLRPYKRTGRILDVGCAAGFFLAGAREDGWTPHGVEISAHAIEYARDHLALENVSTSLDAFAERSFDVVTLWETIEHLDDPIGCLRQAASLLRPGGLLAISTPNLDSLCFRIIGSEWWPIMPFEHFYYFTPTTLKRMLVAVGYGPITVLTEDFAVARDLALSGKPDQTKVLGWTVGPDVLEKMARFLHAGADLVAFAEKPEG